MAKKPHRPFRELAEIERIIERFGNCTLPCDEWTHAAHLTVGMWTAREFPPAEALDRVRAGIVRYNAHCVVVDSPGYHETITRFYMWQIGKYLADVMDRSDWVAVTNGLVEHAKRESNLPLAYYSRDVLTSEAARTGWVPPDLRPLE